MTTILADDAPSLDPLVDILLRTG
ncbi:MAG: hypothetical protein QOF90_3345, partial [Acetobacteraceae bacterium]|nr:hypothetical protein [Acetobacteraceae bacterium]